MKLLKERIVLCFLASLHLQAFAGAQDGPFVGWVSRVLRAAGKKSCGRRSPALLEKRSSGKHSAGASLKSPDRFDINFELLRRGMLKGDKKSKGQCARNTGPLSLDEAKAARS